MNAHIVPQERCLLLERTIVGLRVVKEALRFQDPQQMQLLQSENVP